MALAIVVVLLAAAAGAPSVDAQGAAEAITDWRQVDGGAFQNSGIQLTFDDRHTSTSPGFIFLKSSVVHTSVARPRRTPLDAATPLITPS